MKYISIIALLLLPAFSFASHQTYLNKNYPEQFPKHAEYKVYKNLCNPISCFDVVSVFYVTETMKGMSRLAVFSQKGDYLGSYSGLMDLPIKAEANVLQFPASEAGDKVVFDKAVPPQTIWLDGELFNFQKK